MTATLEIERRPLGRTEQTIPRIALGCGNFGGVGSAPAFFGQGLSEHEAIALMDAAWELGITHFDTADAYGGGRSEAAIGRWIKARGIRPAMTTKTLQPDGHRAPTTGSRPTASTGSSSRASSGSGVDRVELYLAHEFDPDVPLADTIGAFEELRRRRPDPRLRRQQLRRRAAGGGARSGRAPGDPERVLAAGARRRGRRAAAVRARAGRLPRRSARWPAVG